MLRYVTFGIAVLAAVVSGLLSATVSSYWLVAVVPTLILVVLGLIDIIQPRHSIRRNFPILGRLRWLMELIRPEIQQYFVESDIDGTPFNRDIRSLVYERAKNLREEEPFGTELDVYAEGYEWFDHSLAPRTAGVEHRVTVGGPQCGAPYEMSLLNVSAMSFGSLSGNAIRALNEGAQMGGFAHDTGEGGLSRYHLEGGGDLVWEIGSGYFGCRTPEGAFDAAQFAEKAAAPAVKCISIKLSQGAKPGLGGVMPASKVSAEIAEIRGIPEGEKCVSPPAHSAFGTPRELVRFAARLRELSGGKPVGFKLCVGNRREFLGICKAMLDDVVLVDFVIVDGSEGGTGAAPLEFVDHVGTPLTEGLIFVHNALVGVGLRDHIKIGCAGKVATGFDIVSRLAQGADFTNSARAMMFAIGCIQAQRCHTNTCPVGVATQDPSLVRALVVEDKAERVRSYHANTVAAANALIASMGLERPSELGPDLLRRRVAHDTIRTYAEIYDYLEPGALVGSVVPDGWVQDWSAANADSFAGNR